MLERPDAVLAAIPVLAVSGLALRSLIATTGVATGLLAAPLAPAGYLAALGLVFRELLVGPVAKRAS
ncbi:hypothetical protein [Natronobacterium gregoryi]|uniref:Uncharacterized protein n=2 Tax=Natronobacterium gregoryi TaxID=44930 RepID=L0ADV0_NATGS|nr:hypothetical protein [Natronobacterium gregoryi]AFZ72083.1 hypothetical protein Natgr_0842 [Natronobacterium gregoryi SP2]ELY62743.1 hypothetical protein C490_17047 [Natronobacterium gregoryi SP2]PLK20057.1 hypothetical protein CYV19_11525 [Natronobacterium gregoryi SP2]SFJ44303.1 hypothetical protein SAMN05443661_1306 [Natronobacterium gregoryi]